MTAEHARMKRSQVRGRGRSSVREALAGTLGSAAKPAQTIADFTFVGMGTDPNPPPGIPASVDHDRWYAEAVANRWDASDEPNVEAFLDPSALIRAGQRPTPGRAHREGNRAMRSEPAMPPTQISPPTSRPTVPRMKLSFDG